MLIDTHCHLDAFGPEPKALADVVQRALAAGVERLVVPAVSPRNFELVRRLCERFPELRYALGIHPMFANESIERGLGQLEAALADAHCDPNLIAVGEIGLDFPEPAARHERQEALYLAQLEIAARAGLPVLLHVRRSQDRLLKYLRRVPVSGGIAHAFNGSRQQADEFIKLGFALGFGGVMTRPRAHQIRRLAMELPLHSIVLETDAPDMAPNWLAPGSVNEPAQVAGIALALAQLRGDSLDTLLVATAANARRVLPRLN